MELTDTAAQVFAGGQIKMQNQDMVFCGEIREISVVGTGNDALLRVRLNWKARGQGPAQNPRRWVNEPGGLNFEVSLALFHVFDLGKGRRGLRNVETNELVFLYPQSAPSLNPNDVVGLRQLP
jgi:hypothetical protein